LKFAGSRRFDAARLKTFARLERRLGVDAGLVDAAAAVVQLTVEHWPRFAEILASNTALRTGIESSIAERTDR